MIIEFLGYQCEILLRRYTNNGAIYLQLVDVEDRSPVGTATTNLPDYTPPEGHVLIKNFSENEGILEVLTQAGIITPTGIKIPTGYCYADLCKLNI